MSLVNFVPEKNRACVRRFDHEEALRRYEAGERVADLAAEYGVSISAVYRVLTPGAKAREVVRNREWRTGNCDVCGGPAMRLIGSKLLSNPDGCCLCVRCRADARRERLLFNEHGTLISVRCTNEECANGERWQPPKNFTRGIRHREVREGGIHGLCRSCQTAAKRRYRQEHDEYNARQNSARLERYHERRRNGEAPAPTSSAE